jgi:NlpC/P60 family putative phage cell wall peptidase
VTIGSRVLAEARGWIGTPYLHQASVKGAGTDCLGLLRGVWRSMFGDEPEAVPPYTDDWAESSGAEVLLSAAERWLVRKDPAVVETGDVLLFRMRQGCVAKHLGIQSEIGRHPAFVHAFTNHGVVESPLSHPWQRRIAARFSFPDGAK